MRLPEDTSLSCVKLWGNHKLWFGNARATLKSKVHLPGGKQKVETVDEDYQGLVFFGPGPFKGEKFY